MAMENPQNAAFVRSLTYLSTLVRRTREGLDLVGVQAIFPAIVRMEDDLTDRQHAALEIQRTNFERLLERVVSECKQMETKLKCCIAKETMPPLEEAQA